MRDAILKEKHFQNITKELFINKRITNLPLETFLGREFPRLLVWLNQITLDYCFSTLSFYFYH